MMSAKESSGRPADSGDPTAAVAIELIRAGRVPVNRMITHRLSLAEAGLGFKLVADAKESIKVIVEPQR